MLLAYLLLGGPVVPPLTDPYLRDLEQSNSAQRTSAYPSAQARFPDIPIFLRKTAKETVQSPGIYWLAVAGTESPELVDPIQGTGPNFLLLPQHESPIFPERDVQIAENQNSFHQLTLSPCYSSPCFIPSGKGGLFERRPSGLILYCY